MTDPLRIIVDMKINDGQFDAFTSLRTDANKIVSSEKGTLGYDWFLDDHKTTCVLQEEYVDNAAILAHLGNVGENILPRLLSACTVNSLRVLGPANDEVRSALAPMGATFHTSL